MAGEQVSKRSVVYEILVDFQQGKKTITDAEKAIRDMGKAVNATADEVIKYANSLNSSVQKLRVFKNAINNFKGSDKDFQKLTLEAAKLQDQLDKTNRRIRTLASSTRQIEALASGVQGLVGVFTAVQGAVALFGEENKNLQKAILRVQGALALLQGVQAAVATVTEQSAFKTIFLSNVQKAYAVVVGTTTGALKAFRIALAASGIGIAVIAITALLDSWGLFNSTVDDSTDALEGNKKALQDTIDEINRLDDILGTQSFNRLLETLAQQRKAIQKNWMISEAEKTKQLKENEKEREQINLAFAKFINERAKKDRIAEKKLAVELTEEGTKERLEAEVSYINAVRDEELKQFGLTQNQKLLIIQDTLNKEKELRDKFNRDNTPQAVAMIAPEKTANQILEEQIKNLEDAAKARTRWDEHVKASAEVQRTAHQMLIEDMQEEKEMRERLALIAQSSATILNNLAQLASDNANAQLGLSIASIVAANAEALAKGVASAASVPWPGNIAAIFSTIATITSIFAQITALSKQAKAANSSASSRQSNAVAFAEGTPYLDDASAPHGRDTIPIWADRGEAIIPTRKNMEEPGLAAAWINGNLDDYINVNYVAPALAAKTIEEIEKDSMIDYSNRFYKQLLVTAEGNAINKKALTYLSSINDRLNRTIPSRYA